MTVKLSKYQTEIVSALKEDGAFLCTNEGVILRAWIGDRNGAVIEYVRMPSAVAIYNAGLVKLVEGDYPDGILKYELVAR